MSIGTVWTTTFYDEGQFEQFKQFLPTSRNGVKINYEYVDHSRQEEQDSRITKNNNILSTFKFGMIIASSAAVIAIALKVLAVAGLIGIAATPVGWAVAALALFIGSLVLGIFLFHKYQTRNDETDPTAGISNYSHKFGLSNPLPLLARRHGINGEETVRVYYNDHFDMQGVILKSAAKPFVESIVIPVQKKEKHLPELPVIPNIVIRNPPLLPIPEDTVLHQKPSIVTPQVVVEEESAELIKSRFEKAKNDLEDVLAKGSIAEKIEAYSVAYGVWEDYSAKKFAVSFGSVWNEDSQKSMANSSGNIREDENSRGLKEALIKAREHIVNGEYNKHMNGLKGDLVKFGDLDTNIEKLFKGHTDILKKFEDARKFLKLIQYVYEYSNVALSSNPHLAHEVYKKIKSKVKDLTSQKLSDWADKDKIDHSNDNAALGMLKAKLDNEVASLEQSLLKIKKEPKKAVVRQVIALLKDASPFIENLGKKGLVTIHENARRQMHKPLLEMHVFNPLATKHVMTPQEVAHSALVFMPGHFNELYSFLHNTNVDVTNVSTRMHVQENTEKLDPAWFSFMRAQGRVRAMNFLQNALK